jgi:hypothetical protein
MADFDAMRKGLATVIKGQIPGLRVYPYDIKTGLQYPCLIISRVGDMPYNPILQAGGFQAPLICLLRVESANVEKASRELEAYRWPNGEKSLFAAVNADHTLDGSVLHAYIISTGEPERDPDGEERINEWQSVVTIQITHAVN